MAGGAGDRDRMGRCPLVSVGRFYGGRPGIARFRAGPSQNPRVAPARSRLHNARVAGFDEELKLVGFTLTQEKRDGSRSFSLARNRFLTYWLHVPYDGLALFTWELAIGEYMHEYGLQLGTNEPLNQFLFPQVDQELEPDLAEVVKAMERVEASFAGMDFGARSI